MTVCSDNARTANPLNPWLVDFWWLNGIRFSRAACVFYQYWLNKPQI